MLFKYNYKDILSKINASITLYSTLLFVILALSLLVRFIGLGYSDFYGDETKTFYLDKTIPAFEFFMDQRKGPIQFIVVWVVEKIINGHDELYTRIPFALAGFFSVIVFYLLSKDLLGKLRSSTPLITDISKSLGMYIPLLATILYSFNGFNIAFSRVIQYQSFLLLFGLLGVYLFLHKKYLFSAISLGIALLAHYDAIFFLLPICYLFFLDYKNTNIKNKVSVSKILLSFVVPLFIIIASFYIPYVYKGYFEDNALNYLNRRINGDTSMQPNNTMFTTFFYNPYYAYLIVLFMPLLGFILFSLFNKKLLVDHLNNSFIKLLLVWFLPTFVFYEIIVSNPGTHIHNYFIPLYILSAYSLVYLYDFFITRFKEFIYKHVFVIIVSLLGLLSIFISFLVFVPYFSFGYPWNVSRYNDIHNKNQIFIYGFPYNRSWNDIKEYFNNLDSRVTGIFTNDDDTIAEYYLLGFIYTRPGPNFFPQYYIDVKDNQSFLDYKSFVPLTKEEFLSSYMEVERFDNVVIYKLLKEK